jgi:predicted phage replisome organizer
MKTADNQTKRFYWLKLKDNFFDREEIQLIESLPNGKEYVLILLKFMMKAINSEGRLVVKDVIPYNPQMLATVTHSNVDTVRSAIDIFIKFGLMSTLDDGTLYMNEVQALLGSETEFAAKKREYRQNQKSNPQLPDKSQTKKDIVSDNVRQENRDKTLENKNIPLNPPIADSGNNLGIADIWTNLIKSGGYSFSDTEINAIRDFAVYKSGFDSVTEQQIKYTLDILSEHKKSYNICRMIKHSIASGYKAIMTPTKAFLINGADASKPAIVTGRYPSSEYITPETREQKLELRNYLERCYMRELVDPRTGLALTSEQKALFKAHYDFAKSQHISITEYIYQNEVLTGSCLLDQPITGKNSPVIDSVA